MTLEKLLDTWTAMRRLDRPRMGGHMSTRSQGTALITGASAGIGAVYADRLARRGHDLILVARNRQRLDALAIRLSEETGRSVEVLAADLEDRADLARVEQVHRTNVGITVLVNNAGIAMSGDLASVDPDRLASKLSRAADERGAAHRGPPGAKQ